MSDTCPECGCNIQTDEEIRLEVINDLEGVVAMRVDTLETIRDMLIMFNEPDHATSISDVLKVCDSLLNK